MPRLFFRDPIAGLYMMREFGVKLECKNSEDEIQEYDLPEHDIFYPFEESMLEQPEHIWDLKAEFKDFRTVYVTKESEHIFKAKDGDLGIDKLFYPCEYFLDEWGLSNALAVEKGGDIEGKVKIIMREGKHFIAAEVEL